MEPDWCRFTLTHFLDQNIMVVTVGPETATSRDERPAEAGLYDQLVIAQKQVRQPATGTTPPVAPVPSPETQGTEPEIKDLFRTVRRNIVQSIRAFRVTDLAAEAQRLEQHFLYAYCAQATTKAEVLDIIARSFTFPKQYGKNFDVLGEGLTQAISDAGDQPGFVVVLDGLPCTPRFDKEARETLLDVFRDAADFWSERKTPFRVFFAFS
jgi:Barstar (barnase inhibitor)